MHFNNVKCSFTFENSLIEDGNTKRQLIYKIDKVKISIYAHSPTFLNATGLQSSKDIEHYKHLFEKKYGQKCKSVKIDNVFISKKDFKNIDMHKVYYYIKECYGDTYRVEYNIELFPGMFLYPKQKHKPNVLLFRTASYQMIGGCNNEGLWQTRNFIEQIIDMFCKS